MTSLQEGTGAWTKSREQGVLVTLESSSFWAEGSVIQKSNKLEARPNLPGRLHPEVSYNGRHWK